MRSPYQGQRTVRRYSMLDRFRMVVLSPAQHSASFPVFFLALAIFAMCWGAGHADAQTPVPNPCPNAQPVPLALHLPANLPPGEPVEFEQKVLHYLSTLEYRKLGWCE